LHKSLNSGQKEAESCAKSNPNAYLCIVLKNDGYYYVTSPVDAWGNIMFGPGWDWKLVYYCRYIVEGDCELFIDEKATKKKSCILQDCLQVEVFSDISCKNDIKVGNLKFAGWKGYWTPSAAPAIPEDQIMIIVRNKAKELGDRFLELLQPTPIEDEHIFSKAASVQSRSYFAAYMLENDLTELSFNKTTANNIGHDIVNDTSKPEYDVVEKLEGDRIILTLVKNEERARWRLHSLNDQTTSGKRAK
jgi:hypothetical protein